MQLQQASDRFDQITQEIATLLQTIRGEVSESGSHFTGEAATSFRSVMARYDGDATRLNQALRTIAEAISTSGRTFHQTDDASRASITTAASGLNM